MNSATIKRGSGNGTRANRSGRRPRRSKSAFDRVMDYVPLSPAQINRLMTWGIGLILVALFWLAASFLGLPAMLRAEVNDLAARTGFAVAKIEVRGLDQMDEMQVSDIAVKYVERSMLAVDLDSLRGEVMTLGWVKEARISRRLPDALIVDVVERLPDGRWLNDGQLTLIDAGGVALAPVAPDAIPDLPLVVGPDANKRTQALASLMDSAPALKPMLAGATWVGNRRWDLRFQSGEQLMLPEGEAEATAALVNFARMDGVDRLLGRGVLRFDMRDPARFVLRLPPGKKEDAAPTVTSATGEAVVAKGEDERPATSTAQGGEG